MLYLTNVNLNQYELQNAVIQPLATPPAAPKLGQIYVNSATSKVMWYNGKEWAVVGVFVESSAVNGKIKVDGVEMTVYELPMASTAVLGGVKIGAGLAIDANGVLSTTDGGKADSVEWEGVLNKPATITNIDTEMGKKVDKVTGKGLSTNDYTTVDKNKLGGIAAGAQVNVKSDWDATTGDAQILNKPTALSEFTNDENFIDNTVTNLTNYYTKTQTFTKDEVNNLISAIATLDIQKVDTLPTTNISSTTLYLVPKSKTGTQNVCDEYLYVNNTWEKVGDTEIDLSNYLQKTGDASKTTVAFTAAAARSNIVTGETFAVIAGKVAKYFADLKSVAFTGSYNDLSNTPALAKTTTFSVATNQTSNSVTVSGTTVVGVTVVDSVTKEVVLCDVTINGPTVTVEVVAAPTNALTVTVAYI